MKLPQTGSAQVVDLSVTLSERLPSTWPGHMVYAHKNWNWYTETKLVTGLTRSTAPYQTNFIIMDEHCGTHFDAPVHWVPPENSGLPWAGPLGEETGEKVPLEDLMGPAAIIDVRFLAEDGKPGKSPFITADHIKAWEDEHGEVQAGDVVLLWTGWDRYYIEGPEGLKYTHGSLVTGELPGWPAPDPGAALHLHERGVKTIGIDAPRVGAAHEGAPVHQEGLSRGLRYVELLTGLENLPTRGAYFVFLPLKIEDSSAGPGRAIALVPK